MFGDNEYTQAAMTAARNRSSIYAAIGVECSNPPPVTQSTTRNDDDRNHGQYDHSLNGNYQASSRRRPRQAARHSHPPSLLHISTSTPIIPLSRKINLHLVVIPQNPLVGYQVTLQLWESSSSGGRSLGAALEESGVIRDYEAQSGDFWSLEVLACGHRDVRRWLDGSRDTQRRSRSSLDRRLLGQFTHIQSENERHWDWWVRGLWEWFPEGHGRETWSVGVRLAMRTSGGPLIR